MTEVCRRLRGRGKGSNIHAVRDRSAVGLERLWACHAKNAASAEITPSSRPTDRSWHNAVRVARKAGFAGWPQERPRCVEPSCHDTQSLEALAFPRFRATPSGFAARRPPPGHRGGRRGLELRRGLSHPCGGCATRRSPVLREGTQRRGSTGSCIAACRSRRGHRPALLHRPSPLRRTLASERGQSRGQGHLHYRKLCRKETPASWMRSVRG